LEAIAVTERGEAELTSTQWQMLDRVSAGTAALSDLSERIDDARVLIERGYLQLRVEIYEWGLDWIMTRAK
jgi:hypothetical protein